MGYIEVLKNICIHHLYNLSIINAINLDDNFTQKLVYFFRQIQMVCVYFDWISIKLNYVLISKFCKISLLHVKSNPQEHAIFCKIKRSLHNLLDIYEVYYFFHIASSARILQPVNQILYQEPATFISVFESSGRPIVKTNLTLIRTT